jgi:hypothetical protein
MKKTILISDAKNTPARAIEAIKSELRKYVKRERNKQLPEGVDFWDFDCKVGETANNALPLHVAEINSALDHALADEWAAVYFEILAKPAVRTYKAKDSISDL